MSKTKKTEKLQNMCRTSDVQQYVGHRMSCTSNKISLFFLIFAGIILCNAVVSAAPIDDLRSKISDRSTEIEKLKEEIAAYEKELDTVGKEKKTLQGAVTSLNVSIKKLGTNILLTENTIVSTATTIEVLDGSIADKELRIKQNLGAIAEAIRGIAEEDHRTVIEALLSHENLSTFWETVDSLERFEFAIQKELATLRTLREGLATDREAEAIKKQELEEQSGRLNDEKKLTEYQKIEKNRLLGATKNKEKEYQSILQEKIAKKEAFEREIFQLESELKFSIDPSSYPSAAQGVLEWPLESITVTQPFGDTEFSRANARVYNGKGHNGVDFRASVGTPVYASLDGVVQGVGDTDVARGCYSYGKWVLIKHGNGLSTLYAHLSLIRAIEGQTLAAHDIVGYSGATGYSTGPHLHFTVYASQGVRVQKFDHSVNCKNAVIPIASLEAYLNPLSYLPAL